MGGGDGWEAEYCERAGEERVQWVCRAAVVGAVVSGAGEGVGVGVVFCGGGLVGEGEGGGRARRGGEGRRRAG